MKETNNIKYYRLYILSSFFILMSCSAAQDQAVEKWKLLNSKAEKLDSIVSAEIQKVEKLDSFIEKELDKVRSLDSLIHSSDILDSLLNIEKSILHSK